MAVGREDPPMTLVAEFTIPPEAFPFGETLAREPEIEIEVDRIVPTGETALPFFWVRGCHPEEFMAHAEAEPAVEDTRLLETVDETALFRAKWRPNAAVVRGLERLDATIVESVGTPRHWRFEVRAQDRDTFAAFQEVFEEQDIPIDLHRLYDLEELVEGDHRALTPDQRQALLMAYREGYFDTPRSVTQDELGERLDVSGRAVSERLRRGISNLVASTLLPDAGPS